MRLKALLLFVLWFDSDTKDIPEPRERDVGYYENFFDSRFVKPIGHYTDIPRLIRAAVDKPKAAMNVNELDEVPDSSWYTNRHHRHRMSIEALVRGPNQGPGPDFRRVTVTQAKPEGVTPGLMVTDAHGIAYLIKFDRSQYPELQSSAEVISTKILHAAGYNVPENYIAYIDRRAVRIAPDVTTTQKDLDRMFKKLHRTSDGRYRVMASKILDGKPKGPFAQTGLRMDDPNDRIPHEHRRELRGLRVISSWINNWDMKEPNTLDMYVQEDGRRFLRHYLIDFGSTLGAGANPKTYYHGRTVILDCGQFFKEVFTLGFASTAWDRKNRLISSSVGSFSLDDFRPEDWTPALPWMPFNKMTDEDAFWAVRVLMSFSEAELGSIVREGKYSNPKDEKHVIRTLLERRRRIADYWLGKVNPIADFRVVRQDEATALVFRNLAGGASGAYQYRIGNNPSTRVVTRPSIRLSAVDQPFEVSIWNLRDSKTDQRVRVFLKPSDKGRSLEVVRVSRE
jgi:hypothetical protein